MKTLAILLLTLLATASASNASALDTVVSDAGEIRFTARYEGQPLDGVFPRFRVELQVERPGGEPRGLRVTVATGSADMNDREVNEELKTPTFFDASNWPEAVFSSETIKSDPDGTYSAVGTIEVKGATLPLTVPFRLDDTGRERELTGEVSVSRLAWGVGLGEWAQTDLIADEVVVRFRVEFPGATP
jgi:polyisoprenoid-binding protein YceI